ncbi:MAG: nitroreductase, partial [Bacteroidia bacterium]|nr:nitroreductase [Bacteroidia bacterium]
KHTLPWYFQVFSGTSLQKLTNKIVEINELDPNENTSSKSEKINQIPSEVSHILAICMKRNPEHSIPETEEICAVACAVENIYIGLLQFEDVGGYWCTGNGTYTPEMHHFLELTTEDKCLGFFFIGKLKQKRTHSNRPPVSNYIRWNL